MQRRYHTEDLEQFLRLVDAELPVPCSVLLVGGAAWLLGYRPNHSAHDLELWSASDDVIWTAAERASEKVPRPIPLRQQLSGEPRCTFESRAREVPISGLRLLTVRVPEPHDLAVLKAARAEPLEPLLDLHRQTPLSFATLLDRFQELRGELTTPRARFRTNFVALVSLLFGKSRANDVEKRFRS